MRCVWKELRNVFDKNFIFLFVCAQQCVVDDWKWQKNSEILLILNSLDSKKICLHCHVEPEYFLTESLSQESGELLILNYIFVIFIVVQHSEMRVFDIEKFPHKFSVVSILWSGSGKIWYIFSLNFLFHHNCWYRRPQTSTHHHRCVQSWKISLIFDNTQTKAGRTKRRIQAIPKSFASAMKCWVINK